MGRSSSDSNAVVWAAAQTCKLYGVDVLRIQSRVMTVEGAAGRSRPMFFGQWQDREGKPHFQGMADLLARPKIRICDLFGDPELGISRTVTLPVWIECKSGRGTVTADQAAFASHVQANGEDWILCHDDMRPLIEWLEAHGLREGGLK